MNPASRETRTASLHDLRTVPGHRLAHAEHALAVETSHLAGLLPAWARPTPGEARWPVVTAVLAAIALQMLLPPRLAFPPHWLLPASQIVPSPGQVAPEAVIHRVDCRALARAGRRRRVSG
jgi:hypothetical protein